MASTSSRSPEAPVDLSPASAGNVHLFPTSSQGRSRASPTSSAEPGPHHVEQALEVLFSHNLPEVRGLLQRYHDRGLQVGGLKSDVEERIRGAVESGKISPAELLAYDDELREHGHQHLFFFRLRDATPEKLAALRGTLREELEKEDLGELPGAGLTIWECREPRLAEVRQPAGDRPELVAKWVWTREWQATVAEPSPDDTGQPLLQTVIEKQRSVSFLRLDLRTGSAQLRLQKRPRNALLSLEEERRRLCEAISRWIDLDAFSPLALGPVIRRWLTGGVLEVRRWRIHLPGRGGLQGDGDPGFLSKLGLFLLKHSPLWLAGSWPAEEGAVRVSLHAGRDELRLPKRCSGETLAAIVERVLADAETRLETPELRALAAERPELEAAAVKVDDQLAGRRKRRVNERAIGRKGYFPGDSLAELLEALARRHPERFALRYQLYCPESHRPASYQHRRLVFDDPAEIPGRFRCQHADGGVRHSSAGNVVRELRLVEKAEEKKPLWRRGLLPRLLELAGVEKLRSLSRRLLEGALLVVFTALFVPLVILTFGYCLELIEAHPQAPLATHLLTGLVALAFLALYVGVVGTETVKGVKELWRELAGWSGGKPREG